MSISKPRAYRSATRKRQAEETRNRIIEAARTLLRQAGFDGATIEAIATASAVSPQTIYAAFGSKRGIVAEIFDRARFGPGYQELIAEARAVTDPRERLRFSARIAREVYDAERATLELLRGAGALAPELAAIEREREDGRRRTQAPLIEELAASGSLREGLDAAKAADILWAMTSRDLYRMLVIDRGWSPARYEDWLGEAILRELVRPPAAGEAPAPSGGQKRRRLRG